MKLLRIFLIVVLPSVGITSAQNSVEGERDANPGSGTAPASSQVTPADSPTVHTSKSGVVTQISVVNPADIDLFSGPKKLSEWLDQLCAAASVRGRAMIRANALMAQAQEAILELDGAAVPYLLSQLQIDPTGQVERQLLHMRQSAQKNTVTLDYLDSIVLPSTRRTRAARALGEIGAPAEEALPLLIKLWAQHSEVQRAHYFHGIQKILHDLDPRREFAREEFSHWGERLAFQTNVVASAIEYCPQLSDNLKSQLAPLLNSAEQGELPNSESADARSK